MNIGMIVCLIMAGLFCILAIIFTLLKDKGAMLISGFNTLPKWKQEKYDRKRMAKDYRNHFALWSVIMLIGALGSWFLSGYFAVGAYIVWLVLFFREVHMDAEKAFAKYEIK